MKTATHLKHASNRRALARQTHGFTLIEILVATVATAILLIALYGVFSRGVRLRDRATARLQEVRLRDRAAGLLRDDLRHAFVTGSRLAGVLEGSDKAPRSRFPGYLRLTTTTAPTTKEAFHGDIQEVEYFVAEDPWSTNQESGALVRALDRNLLAPVREPTREDVLLRGVESMEVRFYDGNNWLDTWEFVDNESMLPVAVEVTVVAAGSRQRTGEMPPAIQLLVPWSIQALAESSTTNATDGASGSEGGSGAEGDGAPPGGGGGPPGGGGR